VEAEARSKDKDRFEGPYRVIQIIDDQIPTGRPRRKDHPKERRETKVIS